jgi:muramoyltetrapeptide carboxypeptidase LdcA involved in peptidoglycan recycling
MIFFTDDKIGAVLDISGGDSANQALPYLDYSTIRANPKPFVGMSNLSVIFNTIYAQSAFSTFHCQIANLIGTHSDWQCDLLQRLFHGERREYPKFLTFDYSWLRGQGMAGIVVGGNIRCFLQLAGTPYLPEPGNKAVFLESLGGGSSLRASLRAQLRQMGYFKRRRRVLLGTFTQMTDRQLKRSIEELVLDVTEDCDFPIAVTNKFGHTDDAPCLPIGVALYSK